MLRAAYDGSLQSSSRPKIDVWVRRALSIEAQYQTDADFLLQWVLMTTHALTAAHSPQSRSVLHAITMCFTFVSERSAMVWPEAT